MAVAPIEFQPPVDSAKEYVGPPTDRADERIEVAAARFRGEKAEEAGVYILPETSGYKLLVDEGKVVGVRTGDKGRGRDGEQLGNFEPGSDVIAKATVLAEGTQGHLAGAAIRHFELG